MRDMTELESLQSHYSDYHKSFWGFRPRSDSDEQWNSIEWLTGAIQRITDHISELEKTFDGRELLRSEGWGAPVETDPELKKAAEWNAAERKRKYDAWVAGIEGTAPYPEEKAE
jgi:hypothetical protein